MGPLLARGDFAARMVLSPRVRLCRQQHLSLHFHSFDLGRGSEGTLTNSYAQASAMRGHRKTAVLLLRITALASAFAGPDQFLQDVLQEATSAASHHLELGMSRHIARV